MPQSLHHLICERGFDSFRDGLEARFKVHRLDFTIHYSEPSPIPSLLVRLENQERAGEICVWESGNCDMTVVSLTDGNFRAKHIKLDSSDGFHQQLAALFLFVSKNEWTPTS
jgi:hypothetical protein